MDKELVGYIMTGMIALFILGWKPLHNRFSGWAVLSFYLFVFFAAIAVAIAIAEPWRSKAWFAAVLCGSVSVLCLVSGKRPPIERRPTVAWMVIHGLWDQLEKEGLPPDEIERLKRLSPEERAALMAAIRVPHKREKPRYSEDKDGWTVNGYGYGRFGAGLYQDGVLISEDDEFWVTR